MLTIDDISGSVPVTLVPTLQPNGTLLVNEDNLSSNISGVYTPVGPDTVEFDLNVVTESIGLEQNYSGFITQVDTGTTQLREIEEVGRYSNGVEQYRSAQTILEFDELTGTTSGNLINLFRIEDGPDSLNQSTQTASFTYDNALDRFIMGESIQSFTTISEFDVVGGVAPDRVSQTITSNRMVLNNGQLILGTDRTSTITIDGDTLEVLTTSSNVPYEGMFVQGSVFTQNVNTSHIF